MDKIAFIADIPMNNIKNLSNGDINITFRVDQSQTDNVMPLFKLRGERVTVALLKAGVIEEDKPAKYKTMHQKAVSKFYATCKGFGLTPDEVKAKYGIDHISKIDTDSIHEICNELANE